MENDDGHPLRDGLSSQAMEPQASPPEVSIPDAWQPIETAPKDTLVLVWFDHDADAYYDLKNPHSLTNYRSWADAGLYLAGEGIALAKWFPQHFESLNEYGEGYWLPDAWFAWERDEWERAVNATHWIPLPAPPAKAMETR